MADLDKLAALAPFLSTDDYCEVPDDIAAALNEWAELRALLELVAGNLLAAQEKNNDASMAADAHLDEAMEAIMRFAPKGGDYGERARSMRLDLWTANGEMSGENAELRKWRSEHDCRYTLGAVADIDGVHCPIDNPCVRCQRRMEWDAAQKEITELRAYKQRTEAALVRLCAHPGMPPDSDIVVVPQDLLDIGLWRDPSPKEASDGQ